MNTTVYVDGFNFYYGALKGTAHKWLDLSKLCQLLLPRNTITKIKYFTAIVSARPYDLDKPIRQYAYLRALRTLPNVEIILGSFLTHNVTMLVAGGPASSPRFVTVVRTEEKGSDVNIAAHMINDGYKNEYDIAALITNDSDLAEPVRLVRVDLKKPVGIINPHNRHPSRSIVQYASFVKQVREGALAASQFPDQLRDAKGTFHKPAGW
jgi:uncharacterized LabA/DUF88 family protein